VDNFANLPVLTALRLISLCEKSVPNSAESMEEDFRICQFPRPLHCFHIPFTASEEEDRTRSV
jgi:hypothetical protein